MRMSLAQAAQAMQAQPSGGDLTRTFRGVSADSRSVSQDELFVALRGPKQDGHNFLRQAFARGAVAAVVERWPGEGLPEKAEATLLKVHDSLHAIGELARHARRNLKARVAAITGTAGKTATKEMSAAICRRAADKIFGGPVAATAGSQNNLVGVPLTLLNLRGDEAVVILELGMNAFGEIARLTQIADPDFGLITNIGLAHLKPSSESISLDSSPAPLRSLDGVRQAKGELWRAMRPEATAVVNLDDPNVASLAVERGGHQVRYSVHPAHEAQVHCRAVRDLGLDGQELTLVAGADTARIRLAALGAHQRANAVAACALAFALGVPLPLIAQGLLRFAALPMRGETRTLGADTIIINDAYNANPVSMAASLRTLAELPGQRRIAVLGDMRELGDLSREAHREIGRLCGALKLDLLLLIGDFAPEVALGASKAGMAPSQVIIFETPAQLAEHLHSVLKPGDRVLLKASRAVALEKVLEELEKARI
jgi:UDP-N-acetylmuramoyl-tripeptide--D-alanyl-D-alanine ligase